MLGAVIQNVTVFDTGRTIVSSRDIVIGLIDRTKTGANALISTLAPVRRALRSTRISAVQELLILGWGSA